MADAGGVISLSQLANDAQLPLPTIHRLVRTLVDLGYVRQEASRQYSLGPRLIRLGETTSRMVSRWARPHMERLAHELGESVNLAMLDGDQVVYVGQVMASRNSMRMFTEVGRRVLPHSTGVGKAIMAGMDPEAVQRDPRPHRHAGPHRAHDHRPRAAFAAELGRTRERGYALDEGEQEIGVRCVAVAMPGHAAAVGPVGLRSAAADDRRRSSSARPARCTLWQQRSRPRCGARRPSADR